jgi:hypothetical protein
MRTGMSPTFYLRQPDTVVLPEPARELNQALQQALRAASGYIADSAVSGNGEAAP